MARFFWPILLGARFARAAMEYGVFYFSKESKKKRGNRDKPRKPLKLRDKAVPERLFDLGHKWAKAGKPLKNHD
jgi:hypothetical protein